MIKLFIYKESKYNIINYSKALYKKQQVKLCINKVDVLISWQYLHS